MKGQVKTVDDPIAVVWFVFFAVLYGIIMVRFLRSRFGKIVKASATVVHKQTVEQKAFKTPPYTRVKYAVTFQIGNKRKSFYVSEISYQGYRKGEKGTLTYRGDRLIDFH